MTTVSRRQLLVGAAATTAATMLAGPAFPSLAAGRRFVGDPGRGRMHYGASYPWKESLPAWERQLGRHIGVRRSYFTGGQVDALLQRVRQDLATARLPHVSTKAPTTWQAVASGRKDDWLENLLLRLKAVGGPVFLTLNHEPENDARGDGMRPSDWVAMQNRAIVKRRQLGAKNVSIVPVLMAWTYHPANPSPTKDWMVPGAQMLGMDCYNGWSPTNGEPWTSFKTRARHAMPYAGGRPIVIGEYGCRTPIRRPARAGDWMDAAFQWALSNNVVAMSFFNSPRHTADGTFELDREREPVFKWLLNLPQVGVVINRRRVARC